MDTSFISLLGPAAEKQAAFRYSSLAQAVGY